MSKITRLDENSSEVLKNIESHDIPVTPPPAQMKAAWNAVLSDARRRKKHTVWDQLRKLLPAAGIGLSLAGSMAAALVILPGVLFQGTKIEVLRYDGGLTMTRQGREFSADEVNALKPGDELKNSGQSAAVIRLPRGFVASVAPGARIKAGPLGGKTSGLTLLEGRVALHAARQEAGKSLEIIALGVTVRVVGTVFSVARSNGTVVVAVSEGAVKTSSRNGTENTISAGYTLTIDQNGNAVSDAVNTDEAQALNDLAGVPLEGSTAGMVRLQLQANTAPVDVYTNSVKAGKLPLGMLLPEKTDLDLELRAEGFQPVRMGLNLEKDQKLSIDLKKSLALALQAGRPVASAQIAGAASVIQDRKLYTLDQKGINSFTLKSEAASLPVWQGDHLLVVDNAGALTAYDRDGKPVWSAAAPGALWFNARVAVSRQYSALATMDQGLTVWDKEGRVKLKLPRERAGAGYAAPVISDNGVLYYLNEREELTAYDLEKQRQLFTAVLDGLPVYPLELTGGGILSYIRDYGVLVCHSRTDGRFLWSSAVPAAAAAALRLQINGDQVLLTWQAKDSAGYVIYQGKNGQTLYQGIIPGTPAAVVLSSGSLWAGYGDQTLVRYSPEGKVEARYHPAGPVLALLPLEKGVQVLTEQGLEIIQLK